MIIVSAPVRVSLSSIDHEPFSSRFGGCAINFCINKRVYIIIRRRNKLEECPYRVSYSKIELCDKREEIEHSLVRGALELTETDTPLEIIYSSDVPAKTGLATSSAMVAALLKGLYHMKCLGISQELLAEKTYLLERQLLKQAGGFQDEYAVVYAGINYLTGKPFEVTRTPISLSEDNIRLLEEHMLLIYTGNRGESSNILTEQLSNLKKGKTLEECFKIKRLVTEIYSIMSAKDFHPSHLYAPVREAWEYKKRLANNMTNKLIQDIENKVDNIDAGAGLRLVGGGGGRGVMLVITSPSNIEQIKQAVHPLKTLNVKFEWEGVKVHYI